MLTILKRVWVEQLQAEVQGKQERGDLAGVERIQESANQNGNWNDTSLCTNLNLLSFQHFFTVPVMSEAAEAAPAVVFKKRKTTGTSASRRTAGNNANEATSGPDGVDDKGEGTSTGAGVVRCARPAGNW